MHARHAKTAYVEQEKNGFLVTVYEYAEAIVCAMVLLVLLFTFFFRVAGVEGGSMEPSLSENDRLILGVHFYEPSYGDVVVINRYTEDPLIKRVIAVAGDTIRIEESTGGVYRNGVLLEEPYLNGTTSPKELTGEVTVPEGYIFVMGDNRAVSKDSRSTEIGMVDVEDVVGKVIFRVWPLNKFGILEF